MGKPNSYSKGDGSVYQRASDGRWCASVTLPSRDGKRRRKVVLAKSKTDARQKLLELRRELNRTGDLTTSSITLGAWLRIWFNQIAVKKIRPRTAATYHGLIENHIIPAIGKIRLDKLTPAHIRRVEERIVTTLKNPDKPESGHLSSTFAAQAYRILSVALKYAEREGRVTTNVAQLVDAPRKTKAELVVLTPVDGLKVLEATEHDRLGSRWWAALLTGARQGELLGLELDRVQDRLDLSWQLQRISWEHGCSGKCGKTRGTDCPDRKITCPADWEYRRLTGGLLLSRPKSDAGWRIIPLVNPLRAMIEQRIAVAASEPNPHGLLWTNDPKRDKQGRPLGLDGSPIDPRVDSEAWHVVLKRAGVPDARLHDARHTTASLLLAANVPEAIIMKILGHSTYAVTRGYQNVSEEQLREALTRMTERMIAPPVVGV